MRGGPVRGDASFAESEGERARPFDVPDELRLAAAALAHDHDGHAALEADENRRHLEHRVAGHAVPPVEQSGAVLVGAEDAGDDRQHLGVLLAQRVEVLPDVEAVKLLDKATERTRIMQSELWAWIRRVFRGHFIFCTVSNGGRGDIRIKEFRLPSKRHIRYYESESTCKIWNMGS